MREKYKDPFHDGCINTTLRVTYCMRRGNKTESAAADRKSAADS